MGARETINGRISFNLEDAYRFFPRPNPVKSSRKVAFRADFQLPTSPFLMESVDAVLPAQVERMESRPLLIASSVCRSAYQEPDRSQTTIRVTSARQSPTTRGRAFFSLRDFRSIHG